jgi:hypothetical protein
METAWGESDNVINIISAATEIPENILMPLCIPNWGIRGMDGYTVFYEA